jgi:hypothetical protein
MIISFRCPSTRTCFSHMLLSGFLPTWTNLGILMRQRLNLKRRFLYRFRYAKLPLFQKLNSNLVLNYAAELRASFRPLIRNLHLILECDIYGGFRWICIAFKCHCSSLFGTLGLSKILTWIKEGMFISRSFYCLKELNVICSRSFGTLRVS